jgi:hypothetical protein
MIDLKDYTKIVIDESLLDDIEDTLVAGDKAADLKMVENWAKVSRKKAYYSKQKRGLVMVGDFLIDDIDDTKYYGTPIKRLTGTLAISGCNIENLEGLFTADCQIEGSLTIEDCPNLVSLKGCPISCKTFTVTGCKKLKEIDITPVVYGNMYLSDNGKRFKEEQLRKNPFFSVGKKVFCSELFDTENLINEGQFEFVCEAFKAPQLKILADALNKIKDPNTKLDTRRFMAHVQLDKIKSSQVYEYDLPNELKSALPAVKQYTTGKRSGFFFTMNEEGEVLNLFHGKTYLRIANRYSKVDNWTSFNNTNAGNIEVLIASASTLVIVDVNGMDATWKINNDREETRKGAIAMMRGQERSGKETGNYWDDKENKINEKQIRYYQQIANANRERYQQMLTKLKAERALKANNFDKFKTKIDELFQRYTALLSKILKNPSKYFSYDVEFLNDKFKIARLSGQGRHYDISEDGLLVAIERYFQLIISANSSRGSSRTSIEKDMKRYEDSIQHNILEVERRLKELESK